MGIFCRLSILGGLALVLVWGSPGALASGDGCYGEGPLFSQEWTSWPSSDAVADFPLELGEQQLPYSPERPDIITQARVKMRLVQLGAPGSIRAVFEFSFPDPKPYGIPFSFQKVRLLWEDSRGPQAVEMDWSNQCRLPGRSLFPGQHWSVSVDIGNPDAIRNPRVVIFGARN